MHRKFLWLLKLTSLPQNRNYQIFIRFQWSWIFGIFGVAMTGKSKGQQWQGSQGIKNLILIMCEIVWVKDLNLNFGSVTHLGEISVYLTQTSPTWKLNRTHHCKFTLENCSYDISTFQTKDIYSSNWKFESDGCHVLNLIWLFCYTMHIKFTRSVQQFTPSLKIHLKKNQFIFSEFQLNSNLTQL